MKYAHQFVTTSLNVGGGIDASQTTGIVLQSLNNIDATKPSVACVTWADPLSTSVAEWITYTSINSTTNELNGVVRGAEGYSAKTHSNGAVVAFPYSKSHINELNDAVLAEHNADGTHSDITADSVAIKGGDQEQGWIGITETLTYASATTITIATGGASRYQKGDKLKLTQTTAKYFYIVNVADTLLTITGGSDYTLANAAITSPFLSRIENPFGFPGQFTWAPTFSASGSMTFTSVTNTYFMFSMKGRLVTLRFVFSGTTGGTASNILRATLPVQEDTELYWTNAIFVRDAAINVGHARIGTTTHTLEILKADESNFALAAGKEARGTLTYHA